MKTMPTFDRLINPLIEALRRLGGSGSVDEIYDKVIELEAITEDIMSKMHDPERSNQTEVGYRLAWARTYLKKYGLVENSSRGVWALTTKAKETTEIDPQDVVKRVREMDNRKETPDKKQKNKQLDDETASVPEDNEEWRASLHHILTKELTVRSNN